eukprot:2502205-Rhodomonas_salina.1
MEHQSYSDSIPNAVPGKDGQDEDIARKEALVSCEWLSANRSNVTILDVRGMVDTMIHEDGESKDMLYVGLREEYNEGHVPGAAFVDWTKDIADLSSTIPVQLADADTFGAAMVEKGVSNDTPVVVYDGGKMMFATRLWWALKLYGHPRVHVLDGGITRWKLEEREVEMDHTTPPKPNTTFKASIQYPFLRTEVNEVEHILQLVSEKKDTPRTHIVDARPPAQFQGTEKRGCVKCVAGRIPNAVNVPCGMFFGKTDGAGYVTLEEMRAVFEKKELPIEKNNRYLVYCNGGIASTLVIFALWQSGVPLANLSNYDGSWGEWGRGGHPVIAG